MHNAQCTMYNFCDKREQSSLLELPSGAKIMNEVSNFCDKREQSNLFELPSEAKIMSEANNSQFSILNSQLSTFKYVLTPYSSLLTSCPKS